MFHENGFTGGAKSALLCMVKKSFFSSVQISECCFSCLTELDSSLGVFDSQTTFGVSNERGRDVC